jgi:hypothetical protein
MPLQEPKRFSLLAVVMLGLSLVLSLFLMPTLTIANTFAHPAFEQEWQANPTLWGNSITSLREPYRDVPGSTRLVQYFDKGRMELTRPEATNSPTYTGDGRIVLEMVSGRVQFGDYFFHQYDGAESPISGDNTFAANTGAPSYRAFQSLLGRNAPAIGRTVSAVLPAPEGEGVVLRFTSINSDPALATLVTNAAYIQQTSHNVPDVFWNYLNQTKPNGEPQFNWRTVFGLPITDAYWTKVRANNVPQDILVQLYERRVLLFNPALPQGQQVYLGNAGTDYYRWRYQLPELPLYDDSVDEDEGSGSVSPKVAEAGARVNFRGSGFTPREPVSAWLEFFDNIISDLSANPVVQIRSDGTFSFGLNTTKLTFPTGKLRYIVIGNQSGKRVILNVRIVGSTRFTPAVEAIQPTDVPEGINTVMDAKVLRVGQNTNIVAIGFEPGERLRGWVTTPFNYVSTWEGLIFSFSSRGNLQPRLVADAKGSIKFLFPAPGYPMPGIFSFTLQGTKSGKTAIAYFRVQAGSAAVTSIVWGSRTFTINDAEPPTRPDTAPVDLNNLPLDYEKLLSAPRLELEEVD